MKSLNNVDANISIAVWCNFVTCISTFFYVFTYYPHVLELCFTVDIKIFF